MMGHLLIHTACNTMLVQSKVNETPRHFRRKLISYGHAFVDPSSMSFTKPGTASRPGKLSLVLPPDFSLLDMVSLS